MWKKRFDKKAKGSQMIEDRYGIELIGFASVEELKRFISEELTNRDAQWEKLLTDNVILVKDGSYLLKYNFIKKIKEKL